MFVFFVDPSTVTTFLIEYLVYTFTFTLILMYLPSSSIQRLFIIMIRPELGVRNHQTLFERLPHRQVKRRSLPVTLLLPEGDPTLVVIVTIPTTSNRIDMVAEVDVVVALEVEEGDADVAITTPTRIKLKTNPSTIIAQFSTWIC